MVKMFYREKKKGYKKLVIVFAGAFGGTNEEFYKKVLENKITSDEVWDMHNSSLHFAQFSLKTKNADFLFLRDFYLDVYGWFIFDKDEFIYKELNKEIEQYIIENDYTEVLALGASKGGTGALVHTLISSKIQKALIMIPDFCPIANYSNTVKEVLINGNKEFEKELSSFFSSGRYLNETKSSRKNFFFVTGQRDFTFKETLEVHNQLNTERFSQITSNVFVLTTQETHREIVGNHDNMFFEIFEMLLNDREVKDERLLWKIDKFSSIVSYAGLNIDR